MKIDANDVAADQGADGLADALDLAETVETVPTLRNFRVEERGTGKHRKLVRYAFGINEITTRLKALVGAWPKRVGALPFYLDAREVKLLDKPEKLFAWVQSKVALSWGGGLDCEGASLVTKQEFFAHVGQSNAFEQYKAAECLPHWPRLPAHYYTWEPPADYTPDGRYLAALLARFTNAETPHDAALLKAMFVLPAWGGPYGARPCFVLEAPDRGCGKTMAANILGRLYGGYLDFDLSKGAEEDLATRLLSEGGLTKRIIRVDNIKRVASGGLMENLITSDDISGKRLFHGESSRPNTLCWVLTANGLRMSRDMAERAFVIRLRRLTDAEKSEAWRAETLALIDAHRDRILADCGYELTRAVGYNGMVPDRWIEFVDGVLSRSFATRDDLAAAVKLNQARRDAHDDDLDEAVSIQEAVDEATSADLASVPFLSKPRMMELVNNALGLHLSSNKITFCIKEHIAAGRITRISEYRTALAKGWQAHRPDQANARQAGQDSGGGPTAGGLDLDAPLNLG
jgi:hypothetical protein